MPLTPTERDRDRLSLFSAAGLARARQDGTPLALAPLTSCLPRTGKPAGPAGHGRRPGTAPFEAHASHRTV
ncbi:hypothetical protein ACWDQO_16130 [Streptomyces sp. NPDC003703]|uniref:hypothetical protein n=1 Tax=Streptomyces sp. NPDC003283 TaxID=3364681 RepID=UPI0036848842